MTLAPDPLREAELALKLALDRVMTMRSKLRAAEQKLALAWSRADPQGAAWIRRSMLDLGMDDPSRLPGD